MKFSKAAFGSFIFWAGKSQAEGALRGASDANGIADGGTDLRGLRSDACPSYGSEENIGGYYNICVVSLSGGSIGETQNVPYPVLDALEFSPNIITTRNHEHLEYAVWLDQAGVMASNWVPFADPEAAVVLSSGTFTKLEGSSQYEQKIDRCSGSGWTFYYEDIEHVLDKDGYRKHLSAAGKQMYKRLKDHEGDDESPGGCELTFLWDEDFTEATISGYLEEYTGWENSEISEALGDLKIELTSYWKWKFGHLYDDTTDPETHAKNLSLDEKCCPPKPGKDCQGEAAIGTEGRKEGCETISDACGDVLDAHVSECKMWERQNDILWGFSYFGYPIGDKHKKPTGYYNVFEQKMIEGGVNQVFYGLEDHP